MTMDRNKLMMLAAGLAAAVVIVCGFLLGIQPQLSSADQAVKTEATVTGQNVKLQAGISALSRENGKLNSLRAHLGKLQTSVPADAAAADLIREYNSLAVSTQTSIVKITNGDAVAYAAPAPAAGASTTATTGSASPSASATPTPTPTATTPAAPVAVSNTLITASNFSAIPVSVEIKGSYAQALAYMKGLHDGPRLFLVTAVTSGVTSDGTETSTKVSQSPNDWTISGYVYALTDAKSAQQSQQNSSSTTAGSTTADGSSTDTAAGK
jgi:Tfp pilus assembly protein PilO